jgi:hypothetical protein
MSHNHTCKYNLSAGKFEGQDACEACKLYDSISQRADAAPTCPTKHYCPRHDYIMSEWTGGPGDEQESVCKVCDMYDKRKLANAEGRKLPYLVVAWQISRHYGGAEEGGWWYDWCEVVDVREAHTMAEGLRQARKLKEEYPQPRFNRFSAANRGEGDTCIGVFYGEDDPRFPQNSTHRPRYE